MPLTIIWAISGTLAAASFAAVVALIVAHAVRARASQRADDARVRMSDLCLDALAGGHGDLPQARLTAHDAEALLDVALKFSDLLDGDAKAALWTSLATRRLGPALASLADDPSAERRLLAARGLIAVAGATQRAVLERLLFDPDIGVASQAAHTLNAAGADARLSTMLARLRANRPVTCEVQSPILRLRGS